MPPPYGRPALFGALILAGIATTMAGPLLPALEVRWHVGDARAGLLFLAQFLASVTTAAAIGPLAARYGYSALIRSGLVLTGVGTLALAAAPWPAGIGAMALCGCGLGLIIPAANLATTGARAIMLVNLAWSIGAVAGPVLLAMSPVTFLWCVAGALFLASAGRLAARAATPDSPRPPVQGISRATAMTALLLFLYVGTENTLAGWISSYTLRIPDARQFWAVLPSVFWAAILAGRIAATVALSRVRPTVLLPAGLLCALSGACLLLLSRGPATIVAAGAISGLGMAPVYPLAVSLYTESNGASSASGLIFSAGGLGGAVIPPLIGFLSESSGSLRLAMSAAPLLIVAMLAASFSVMAGRTISR